MALNKQVCKQCAKKFLTMWQDNNVFDKRVEETWTENDESMWENKREVICPIPGGGENVFAKVYRNPPKWCLCNLEQAVAATLENK